MSNREQPYVDWSKAPEGTTQVLMQGLKVDGTPENSYGWEKVADGVVYEWRQGAWSYYTRECELAGKRIKHPLNTDKEDTTIVIDTVIADKGNIKYALDLLMLYDTKQNIQWKDSEGTVVDEIDGVEEQLKAATVFLAYCGILRSDGFEYSVVDRNEQRKKEIQEQIEKLKEELDRL